jgi:hypothetical protein
VKEGEGSGPVPPRAQFDLAEQRAVRAQFAAGAVPACPRCAVAMTERRIGGGSFGLGYARRREWLICPRCKGSVLFDVQRGTRN